MMLLYFLLYTAFSSIYTFFYFNDNKGDTTRNPEQMFENWKLGFPIGSVQPPPASSEHNSKFLPWEGEKRKLFHFTFFYTAI